MQRPTRALLTTLPGLLAAALTLTACGASNTNTTAAKTSSGTQTQAAQTTTNETPAASNPNEIIARVNTTPITRAQVNHWMTTLGGIVYYNISHTLTLPEGLLSDPPNPGHCVTVLETEATHSPLGHARENSTELLAKCRELNEAVKIEATTYLISTQQNIQIAAKEGITPTPTEIQHLYQQTRQQRYPTPTLEHKYLESHHMTLPDLLLETKLDVIGQHLYPKITTPQGKTQYLTLQKQLTTKTTCQPNYNVEGCNHHTPTPTYPHNPPSALLEQVSATITDSCIDLRGCAKQIGQ